MNSIIIILTDGMDNSSNGNAGHAKMALQNLMRSETLESILTILVGVGVGVYTDVDAYLNDFKTDAGLSQYVGLEDADEQTLAKLADFISNSISSQSQSLNSGGASQPLQF